VTQGVPSTAVGKIDRPSNSEEVKAVCLDVDDTLIDYEHTARDSLRSVLGADGSWSIWKQVADEHVAMVVSGQIDRASMPRRRAEVFLEAVGFLPGEVDPDRWETDRLAEMGRRWTLFEDTLPCLDWLSGSGVKLAAVTNASGGHQREKLADLGVAGFFDCVLIAGEVGATKPDPVMFHTACVRLDLPPAEVVHVGDRLDADAVGARAAGLHGVWLNREGVPAAAVTGVLEINTLGELPELLVSELALAIG
jgi:putative hydrolase of the HAD superfamily